MAQEIQVVGGRERSGGMRAERMSPLLTPKPARDMPHNVAEGAAAYNLGLSAILGALGDESSRRILASAIASGKTVEEISAEQNLPLSTCYRRMRCLLGQGLMILERTVITPTGKRYAIYRTSFSKTAIKFNDGEISVEVTPNVDILDKLRRRWLSANFPLENQDDRLRNEPSPYPGPIEHSSGPFE